MSCQDEMFDVKTVGLYSPASSMKFTNARASFLYGFGRGNDI